MVNLHNLHKIKIPTIQVRLLAVMLIGVLFTPVAFAAGIRDYGQDPSRQCREPSFGSGNGPDPTDWSNPPSGFGPPSTLASDDTIPNCKRMEQISYTSDPTGSGTISWGSRWRYSCAECNSGYHLVSHTMPSTSAVDCVVTWEECVKDTPCAGLVCEGMTSLAYEEYSETPSTHNLTRCNTDTDKCEFRCDDEHYDKESVVVVGNPKNCAACPRNASCAGGHVTCFSQHYLVSEGNIMSGYTKTCPACPTVGLNEVEAWSVLGATSISQCYVRYSELIEDNIGTYRFTDDCYYTTNSGTAN